MNIQKAPSFVLTIIAVILGVTLFKHLDFKTFTTEKPALDALYLVIFIACVYIIVKSRRNGEIQKIRA